MPAGLQQVIDIFNTFDAKALGVSNDLATTFMTNVREHLSQLESAQSLEQREEAIASLRSDIDRVDTHELPRQLAMAYKHGNYENLKRILLDHMAMQDQSLPEQTVESPQSLSSVVSNMSAHKAEVLMTLLSKGSNPTFIEEIRALYAPDDSSQEAENFRGFLQTHSISFLGGGNSKNFRVINNETLQSQVLKVDNRLGMPRHVERHLRHVMGDIFVPNSAERQTTAPVGDNIESRTLLVTDFCPGGDVQQYANSNAMQEFPIPQVANIGSQMADIFSQIQENGCFFPDAKLTNWLVDETGTLRLADTKSFLFAMEDGQYNISDERNRGAGFLRTPGFCPEEMGRPGIQVEPFHASLLGRNLYAAFTGRWPPWQSSFNENHFKHPVFATQQGTLYKDLIKGLTHPDPIKRFSLEQAKERLQSIEALSYDVKQTDAMQLLVTNLRNLSVGQNDQEMDRFILGQMTAFHNAQTSEARQEVITNINKTVNALANNQAHLNVKQSIHRYRQNAKNIFSVGNRAKAARIEDALRQIPVEERVILERSDHPAKNALDKALSSSRYFNRETTSRVKQSPPKPTESLNASSGANVNPPSKQESSALYSSFRKKMKGLRPPEEEKTQTEEEHYEQMSKSGPS